MDYKLMFAIIFTGTFLLIGIILSSVGLGLRAIHYRKVRLCTENVWGQIVDIVPAVSGMSGFALSPIVEYQTPMGMTRQVVPVISRRNEYAVGQAVKVFYDPQRISRYYLEGDIVLITASRIFIWTGVGLAALGVIVSGIVLLTA